ncbi:MAG TPA: lipase family protein [Gemmatimonadales bacterium]|nr:lipase family protein [Gemmatimonadales bacterium]
MTLERLLGGRCGHPFPVYDNLVPDLLAAHDRDRVARDATVAHVLATAAGYSYSDIETLATIMSRLGLEDSACVRVAQTVDAMFILSTVYLVQSRCGRVVILSYRGTEPASLPNWLADADVGAASLVLDGEALGVHAGFYRNLRATQWEVINELQLALRGRSLSHPEKDLDYPMQALYVTGHSLGGALAALFSLSIAGNAEQRAIADKLRAVYTFGQPLTAGEPLPAVARAVARKVFRHVNARDPIPALPPLAWGRFAHFGHEYRFANNEWVESDQPVAQLKGIRQIPGSVLALVATAKQRNASRYSMNAHAPHQYIAALRPKGRVTEFGDQE